MSMKLYVSLCFGVVIPATHPAHKRIRDLVGRESTDGIEVTDHGEMPDRGLVAFVQSTHTSLTDDESGAGVVRLRHATSAEWVALRNWCVRNDVLTEADWLIVRSVS